MVLMRCWATTAWQVFTSSSLKHFSNLVILAIVGNVLVKHIVNCKSNVWFLKHRTPKLKQSMADIDQSTYGATGIIS